MLLFSYEMAKLDYEERLRQAEYERLVQRVLANRPKSSMRLFVSLIYQLSILLMLVMLTSCRDKAPPPNAVAMSVPTSSTQQHNSALSSTTTVNVVATDFAFALEPTTASAGAITFLVANKGQMPHDFALQNGDVEVKTAMLAPAETGTITVDLAPGSYSYVCTVPGHNILGMRGTFTVE